MGESLGNWVMGADEEIMPHITTANVACGFHGGDPVTMGETVALAQRHGVAVGAHPGYPDLLGFGRRRMELTAEDAAAYVTYQTGALQAFLEAEDMRLHHIKPHGAFFAFLRDEPAWPSRSRRHRGLRRRRVLYWPAPRRGPLLRRRGRPGHRDRPGDLPRPHLRARRQARHRAPQAGGGPRVRRRAGARSSSSDGTVTANGRRHEGLVPGRRSACVHGDAANAVAVAQAVGDAARAAGASSAAVTP